jgi:hypothetical protein
MSFAKGNAVTLVTCAAPTGGKIFRVSLFSQRTSVSGFIGSGHCQIVGTVSVSHSALRFVLHRQYPSLPAIIPLLHCPGLHSKQQTFQRMVLLHLGPALGRELILVKGVWEELYRFGGKHWIGDPFMPYLAV